MRVLFFSASTGGGHTKAANALSEYITRNDPSADVLISCPTIRTSRVDKVFVKMIKLAKSRSYGYPKYEE